MTDIDHVIDDEQIYTPKTDEAQLTPRAVFVGWLLGGMVVMINVYFGLQTGWMMSGALISAIIAFGIFSMLPLKKPYTVLENNISETVGSAASGVAMGVGTVTILPALKMMGVNLSLTQLYIWATSIAFLGIFYALPLRRQMVVVEKLRFPTGTATAETIIAMHHSQDNDATEKARVLFWWAVISGAYAIATYFVSYLEQPHLMEYIGLGAVAAWGFTLYVSPLLAGAGMIIGPRVGTSLIAGAIVGWGVLGPYVKSVGWVTGGVSDFNNGVAGWILWPGVALMVMDSLVSLVLAWPMVRRSFRFQGQFSQALQDESIPKKWWLLGLLLFSSATIAVLQVVFGVPYYFTIFGLVVAWLLAMIGTRSLGETDINPITGVANTTQLAYGIMAPGSQITNLMAAGVTGAGATAAGDMMQDFKTGYMIGASPRKQFIAQLFGIVSGIFFSIPVYKLFDYVYDIGGDLFPAPSAKSWFAMSKVLTQGTAALPDHVAMAMLIGGLVGAALPLLRRIDRISALVPSGLAFGIAFIVPPFYSIIMWLGSMAIFIWLKRSPVSAKHLGFAVASGLIVGEGLMGVVKALMSLLGVPTLM